MSSAYLRCETVWQVFTQSKARKLPVVSSDLLDFALEHIAGEILYILLDSSGKKLKVKPSNCASSCRYNSAKLKPRAQVASYIQRELPWSI